MISSGGRSTDNDMAAERLFRHFTASGMQITAVPRRRWRSLICGTPVRSALQLLLLRIAAGAEVGAVSDRRALLMAAYAVLPLHGAPLQDAAFALIGSDTSRVDPAELLEWADLLVDALAERPVLHDAANTRLLNGLERAGEAAWTTGSPAVQRRFVVLARQVAALGYGNSLTAGSNVE